MELPTLTVFTPTYNRAHLLSRLYTSLCEQSEQDFFWLIIDDGSTDNTKELVSKWRAENKIDIQYQYKKNGGFHTAHNLAYKHIKTCLSVCIDSDDFLPINAIEDMLKCWSGIPNKKNIAGMIGLDQYVNGDIIGTKLPEHISMTKRSYLYQKYKVKGDKKIVLRTDVVKQYPSCPEFEGENFVPETTLYTLIEQDYDFCLFNRVWCTVEYQNDGLSHNIVKQYFKSPKGFLYARMLNIKYGTSVWFKIRNILHLVSCCMILKDLKPLFRSPQKLLTLLLFPFGVSLYLYLFYKKKVML